MQYINESFIHQQKKHYSKSYWEILGYMSGL